MQVANDREFLIQLMLMFFAMKAIVFVLGFLTIRMGHSLIRDGVKGNFTFTTEAKGIKGALQSSSPGLLFILLGVGLIAYAMWLKQSVVFDLITPD